MDKIIEVAANNGIAGLMLLWFALRQDRAMTALQKAINRLAHAILMQSVIKNVSAPGILREEAKELVRDIEDEQALDRKGNE